MIIDLVDKLLDRCLDLARYYQKVRINLYENYVNPTYSQFEIVHNNYLESFKIYRELIKSYDEGTDISSIIDKIQEDSLFTANLRIKLFELSKLYREPVIGDFVEAILYYTSYVSGENQPYCNAKRLGLIDELERIFKSSTKIDERKKDKALKALDLRIKDLQVGYSIVTKEYLQLKKILLTE
jgi:hypothetical protein